MKLTFDRALMLAAFLLVLGAAGISPQVFVLNVIAMMCLWWVIIRDLDRPE